MVAWWWAWGVGTRRLWANCSLPLLTGLGGPVAAGTKPASECRTPPAVIFVFLVGGMSPVLLNQPCRADQSAGPGQGFCADIRQKIRGAGEGIHHAAGRPLINREKSRSKSQA